MSVHPVGTLFAILDGGTIVEIEELSALGVERNYTPDKPYVIAQPDWTKAGPSQGRVHSAAAACA